MSISAQPLAGGAAAEAELLTHAMGNTLSASNALYQTYVPANEARSARSRTAAA
jgi:hypothetical protein